MNQKDPKAPALFIGHGSPMNAIEKNRFSDQWTHISSLFPTPAAILVISAHWYTDGTRIRDSEEPKMIYDMYGFPKELYHVNYSPKGSKELAGLVKNLLGTKVRVDNGWGYDHGMWSVLRRMYPNADIPVTMLSIDGNASPEEHFQMGKTLKSLREKNVLILGSGNIVHNLAKINWEMEGGYPWAVDFSRYIHSKISEGDFMGAVQYENAGPSARKAFFTPEHFYPLLYVLGAADSKDKMSVFNDVCRMGSMSMTCYLFE